MIWGVSANHNIYYREGTGGSWTQVSGGLKHVSVYDNMIWGVSANHNIYYREGTGGSWTQVSGGLKQVSVGVSPSAGTQLDVNLCVTW